MAGRVHGRPLTARGGPGGRGDDRTGVRTAISKGAAPAMLLRLMQLQDVKRIPFVVFFMQEQILHVFHYQYAAKVP